MMKKTLVIAFLLISNAVFGIDYNPDGTLSLDIKWYMKDIHAETYEISNANELAGLAALVNGTSGVFSSFNFSGKQVVLTGDIDMEGFVDDEGQCHGPVWIPIGTHFSCRFEGEFDGQGHCIKNFISMGPKSGTLFGYNGGVIRNLVTAGGMVCTQYYGGGICSHNSGLIENCINTANIICSNYGGGICGKNYDEGRIEGCLNLGYVQSGNSCGGIVGSCAVSSASVKKCVYDIQMCPTKKGCGNADLRGVLPLTTAQIIKGEGLDAEMYVPEDGMYPRLAVSEWTPAMRAALYPLELPASESVFDVVSDIHLKSVDGVQVSSPADQSYLLIADGTCKLKAKACAILDIKGGGATRTLFLKLKNATLDFVGTRSAPIRISTAHDLQCFANAVNNCTHYKGFANIEGFSDVVFALGANIHVPDSINWVPIGTELNPFCGLFNGEGLAISNIMAERPFDKYVGLFGYSTGGISKVVLVGGGIVGGDYTGSICGYTSGTVESCLTAVTVRGHYYTGGVVGLSSGADIKDCIHVNSVSGDPSSVGAICGKAMGGFVKHCAFDIQICPGLAAVGSYEQTQIMYSEGYMTAEMVGSKLQTSRDAFKNFYVEDNMYPSPMSISRGIEVRVASTPVFVAPGEDVYNIKSYIDLADVIDVSYSCGHEDMLRITPDKAWPQKQGAVVFTVAGGDVRKNITVRVVNKLLEPLGSEQTPLLIGTYEDLDNFRKAVNLGTDYNGFACIDGFKGVYFRLSNNITCPDGLSQSPIGNSMMPFAGNLDGMGKSISGFVCLTDDRDNVALFGYSNGVLSNLRMLSANISGRYYTGGICGHNTGSILGCSVDSSRVSGTNYAGGICGYSGGRLANCTSSCAVSCDYYAGGMAGNSVGPIDTCVNRGIVSGTSCIGGISGSNNGLIFRSINKGLIKGLDNVGGISGRNSYSQIVECSNSGVIDGGDCSGGIAGLNDGEISFCINDSTVNGTVSVGGISGKGGKVKACINNSLVKSSGNNAGGIMGISKGSSVVERCVNNGRVHAQTSSGGICSDNKTGGLIVSCANFGPVDGANYVGGICGGNSGEIKACMSAGRISGNSYLGSVCGRENSGSNVAMCVYDKDISPVGGIESRDVVQKASGLTTELMKNPKALRNSLDVTSFVQEDGQYAMPDMDLEK